MDKQKILELGVIVERLRFQKEIKGKDLLSKLSKKGFSEDFLSEALAEASRAYYNSDSKLLSDRVYDTLRRELKTDLVGAAPSKKLAVKEHDPRYRDMVGSLDNAMDIEELEDWLASAGFSKLDQIALGVSTKFDGLSVLISYSASGKVESATTRGNGICGTDMTKAFQAAGHRIKDFWATPFAVKYEALMRFSDCSELAKRKNRPEEYVNPRSCVAGIFSDLNSYRYLDLIRLVPLAFRPYGKPLGTREEEYKQIDRILKLAASSTPEMIPFNPVIVSGSVQSCINEIKKIVERTILGRNNLPYMIDGLVIELMDPLVREELGSSDGRPKYARALKLPSMEAITMLRDIEYDFGPLGRITPCAVYDPVTFNGAVQRRCSLQNKARFDFLKLRKNDKVLIQYRGDVLSYLERLPREKGAPKEKRFRFPSECPRCSGELTETKGGLVKCTNSRCPGRCEGKLTNFCEKMEMKGIGPEKIKDLFNGSVIEHANGSAKALIQLLKLKPTKIKDLEGWGERSAEEMVSSINSKLENCLDWEFLGSLGIPGIGRSQFQKIFGAFDLAKFHEAISEMIAVYSETESIDSALKSRPKFVQRFLRIDGMGMKTLESLIEGLVEMKEAFDWAFQNGKLKSSKEIKRKAMEEQGVTKTYRFVVTGPTKMNRNDLKKKAELLGHKMVGAISKKVDFLLTNDTKTGTVKNKEAAALGIAILNEAEATALLFPKTN